jgi:hypothetical protein
MEGFEDAIITPAQMVLVQNGSRDVDAIPGTFKDTITGQSYKEMRIIPLKIICNTPGMSRVLFEEGAPFGSDPLCRSNDGITPSANAQAPQSAKCGNCKHSSWANFAATKKPPACKEKAKILFVERESGLPFMLSLGGLCVTPVKNLLKTLMRLAMLSAIELKVEQLVKAGENKEQAKLLAVSLFNKGTIDTRVGLFDFSTTMSLERRNGNKGTYFVVKFTDTSRVQTVGEFGPLYQELVKARDVLAKTEDKPEDGVETDVFSSTAAPKVHDAEVVADDDSDIPF